MRLITIEFTSDVSNENGDVIRSAGQRMRVDAMTAKSYVEVKKAAKLVGQPAERASAKAAVKAVATPKPDKDADKAD